MQCLAEEERADCLNLIVFLLSRGCYCSVLFLTMQRVNVTFPGLEVIKLEIILRLKIKCNGWLLADTCPHAANHCALFEVILTCLFSITHKLLGIS